MMVIQIVSLEIERWLFLLISRPLFTGTSRYQLHQLLVLVEGGGGRPLLPSLTDPGCIVVVSNLIKNTP